jgi:hypothetical protein
MEPSGPVQACNGIALSLPLRSILQRRVLTIICHRQTQYFDKPLKQLHNCYAKRIFQFVCAIAKFRKTT